jgi:hypothetical protein
MIRPSTFESQYGFESLFDAASNGTHHTLAPRTWRRGRCGWPSRRRRRPTCRGRMEALNHGIQSRQGSLKLRSGSRPKPRPLRATLGVTSAGSAEDVVVANGGVSSEVPSIRLSSPFVTEMAVPRHSRVVRERAASASARAAYRLRLMVTGRTVSARSNACNKGGQR